MDGVKLKEYMNSCINNIKMNELVELWMRRIERE